MLDSDERPLHEGSQLRQLFQQRLSALLEPAEYLFRRFHNNQSIYWLLQGNKKRAPKTLFLLRREKLTFLSSPRSFQPPFQPEEFVMWKGCTTPTGAAA